jgi:transposase
LYSNSASQSSLRFDLAGGYNNQFLVRILREAAVFISVRFLNEAAGNLEKLLEEMVKSDEDVRILRTIPGAGLITAATIRAYADDINRYHGYKQFSSYSGLAPWVQNSNETIRHGRITKRGPEPLRTALVQLVLGMVRSKRTANYRIMERYKSMKSYKGSGKSIIATARKLSKIIWFMLKNRTDFDPSKMEDQALKKVAIEMAFSAA